MTSVINLKINNETFNLVLLKEQAGVEYHGKNYFSLADLVKNCPQLTDYHYPTEIATIANHLFFGMEFILITQPESFKERYWKKIKKEQNDHPGEPVQINRGIFDVNDITKPHLKDQRLFCYIEDRATGIPFKLSFPFPFNRPDSGYVQETLPLQGGDL